MTALTAIDTDATQANVLEALTRIGNTPHQITLWLHAGDTALPLAIHALRYEPGDSSLSLQLGTDSPAPSVWDQVTLTLSAAGHGTFERFERLPLLEPPTMGHGGWLRCGLPARLAPHDERQVARLPLTGSIAGSAEVRRCALDAPVRAIIRDLSVGGCQLEVPLQVALLWQTNDKLDELRLTGPTSEQATCGARVCHVRGADTGPNVLVGIQFTELAAGTQRRIVRWLRSIENEIALRSGQASRILQECAPFLAAERASATSNSRDTKPERPPMLPALENIVGHLGTCVIALRQGEPMPVGRVESSADRMLELLDRDRERFLYALCCLHEQPGTLAHSIAVAGRLADILADATDAVGTPRQRVCAALIHDLGKLMLAEQCLPSEGILSPPSKHCLQQHVMQLTACLPPDWLPANVRRCLIEQVNERLDGSGYPCAITAPALDTTARAAQIVDVVDAMTRARGDRCAFSVSAAYRQIYSQPSLFDRGWLTRYIQRYGMTPIGTLVEYSDGYLAWVMALNSAGQPSRIRAVRHLAGTGRPMNTIIEGRRIAQLGQLVGAALASQYDLAPY
ncbi:MAG: PilZ domain-containing protein [Salinisphaera sp.]|jgi:hypothetical protein|nr:PilZ domain-containing protein [Salinisphaera sp.]